MRRGFDALALLTKDKLSEDPRSGALAIFTNRRRDRKALWWDRNGYCVLYKRFHDAVFEIPASPSAGAASVRIDGQKLATLLAGTEKVRRRRPKLRVVR